MNRYIYLLKITAASAAATSRVCYRQSVKDCWKIYNALTSDQAIALYRFLWRFTLVCMALSIMAGQALRRYVDSTVEASLVSGEYVGAAAIDDRTARTQVTDAGDAKAVSFDRARGRRYLHYAVYVAKYIIAKSRYSKVIRVNRWRRLYNFAAVVNRVRQSRNLGH